MHADPGGDGGFFRQCENGGIEADDVVPAGIALSEAGRGMAERVKHLWDVVGYCGRYGHFDVMDWTVSNALELQAALSAIVQKENGK